MSAEPGCTGQPLELFFPLRGSTRGHGRSPYADARALCAGCPLQPACLEEALELEGSARPAFRQGMFGGHTPQERYALHLERTASAEAELAEAG